MLSRRRCSCKLHTFHTKCIIYSTEGHRTSRTKTHDGNSQVVEGGISQRATVMKFIHFKFKPRIGARQRNGTTCTYTTLLLSSNTTAPGPALGGAVVMAFLHQYSQISINVGLFPCYLSGCLLCLALRRRVLQRRWLLLEHEFLGKFQRSIR